MFHLLILHEDQILLENVNGLGELCFYFLLDDFMHVVVGDRVFILFQLFYTSLQLLFLTYFILEIFFQLPVLLQRRTRSEQVVSQPHPFLLRQQAFSGQSVLAWDKGQSGLQVKIGRDVGDHSVVTAQRGILGQIGVVALELAVFLRLWIGPNPMGHWQQSDINQIHNDLITSSSEIKSSRKSITRF